MKKIAITTGDPTGIGPEIATKELRFHKLQNDCVYIVYGSLDDKLLNGKVQKINSVDEAVSTGIVYLIEIDSPVSMGKVSQQAGKVAYEILERCAEDITSGKIDAVVTCPICKQAIQFSHPEFIGHTEYFAQKTDAKNVTMTFWGQHFQLALLSTHLSLRDAIKILSKEFITEKLHVIVKQFSTFYPICRFAVLAINPHAGEAGAFGGEDVLLGEIIQEMKREGIDISGPFPSDTFFNKQAQDFDVIISAFHDQGLIPFKMLSSAHGVNVTLGLPVLRTSVDHGTAFDIAGKGVADEISFSNALAFAENGYFQQKSTCIYGKFAQYYDHYMKHVNYDNWVDFIFKKYSDFNKKEPVKILELACGTGNIAHRLENGERDIYAMDNSPEMLKIAARKCKNVTFFLSDFRHSLPYQNFDFILLLFDSINYLHEPQDIVKLFQVVYDALEDGGIFIFDISTVMNCEENFDGFVNLEEDLHSYMIHQSIFDYEKQLLKTKLTFFERNGFFYERFDEEHQQKIYLCSQMVKIVKKSQLKLLGIFSRQNPGNLITKLRDDLDNNYQRLYFILQK
jgi:4-hydroxythreonine-4-phosphate dehydrogenase